MAYTADQIEEAEADLRKWADRLGEANERVVARRWRTKSGEEFGCHGLGRRLHDLDHTAQRIFEVLPMSEGQPSRMALKDATAFLQCFVINCSGAIDNVAHVWISEANIRHPDGSDLRNHEIGFSVRAAHRRFVSSLPRSLAAKMSDREEWQRYLTSYRHALAHRIPPYIPPRQWTDEDAAKYNQLDIEKLGAIRRHDWNRIGQIESEQGRIGHFNALMMHSYGAQAQPMWLHPQLICDLATIVDLSESLLDGLDALPEH